MAKNALSSSPALLPNATAGLVTTLILGSVDDYASPTPRTPLPEHLWRPVPTVAVEACSSGAGDNHNALGALLGALFATCLVGGVIEWVWMKGANLVGEQKFAGLKRELDALKKENAISRKHVDVLEVRCWKEAAQKEHLEKLLEKEKAASRQAFEKSQVGQKVEGDEVSALEKKIAELEQALLQAKQSLRSTQKARKKASKRNERDVVDILSVMEVIEGINNGNEVEKAFVKKLENAIVEFADMKKSSYLARYCIVCLGDLLLRVRGAIVMSNHVVESTDSSRVPGVVCVALKKGNDAKEGRYIEISDPRMAEWIVRACRNAEGLDVVWCREGFPHCPLGHVEDKRV